MLKLISVNIEKDRHLTERVLPFIAKEQPTVLCLQEVCEKDLTEIKTVGNFDSYCYAPMTLQPSFLSQDAGILHSVGVAIFVRGCTDVVFSKNYYVKDENVIPFAYAEDRYALPSNVSNVLCSVTLRFGSVSYACATTHCCVTPNGDTTPYQITQANDLLRLLEKLPSVVFCGDLNAPRGRETFALFAQKYTDNIPPEYDSSIDPVLHRVSGLRFMVDGLFSTPDFLVKDVSLVTGVSDHKAVVGFVEGV